MILTIEAEIVQRWLQENSPLTPSRQPMFRLVWSDDQRELRLGTFNVYSGDTFLRTEQKVESCLKYSWIKERWIVEQWFPPTVCLNPELPESRYGSYEPLYVFEDGKGNELPLALLPVQFILQQCLKPKTSEALKKSIAKQSREAKEQLSYNQDVEVLNEDSALVSQFHDGTAILRP